MLHREENCFEVFLCIIYYLHITQYTYAVLKCLKTQRLQLYYGNLNLHGFMVVTTTCLINFVDSVGHDHTGMIKESVNNILQ